MFWGHWSHWGPAIPGRQGHTPVVLPQTELDDPSGWQLQAVEGREGGREEGGRGGRKGE